MYIFKECVEEIVSAYGNNTILEANQCLRKGCYHNVAC